MAAIDDLLKQITDETLRSRLLHEINRLKDNKQFGLVWETHQPENAQLPGFAIRPGSTVALRDGSTRDGKTMTVVSVDAKATTAICRYQETNKQGEIKDVEKSFPLRDLIAIARCGEPIFPTLRSVDKVCNAPDSDLWHTLIEADNYHALQLLSYLYPGQVDCIYIDPPYNTGARDWKYNNDYVDSSDKYRHSKWLSMMQSRLELAKKLLNPKDSVLIVTIDEKEYLHLGCLLEQMFPEANIQMISSVINPAGVSRGGQFARTDEYLFFVTIGVCHPSSAILNDDWRGKIKGGYKDKLRWNGLQRSGTDTLRSDRPNMFYPIYITEDGKKIVSLGDSIPLSVNRTEIQVPKGQKIIWPLFPDGTEGRWRIGRESLQSLIDKHYVHIGKIEGERAALTYLAQGEQAKVERGDFPIIGYREDGSIIVNQDSYEACFIPGTQWWITSHDATQQGTKMLNKIIGKRFSFPKSLYAVHDTIRFFVANKPNALIVDFFAGSGTTLHAVNLLNAEDGGNRRCIMVTNNEVGEAEAREMRKRGLRPGDGEWERFGIARYVNWPRTVCSIKGIDVNGQPIKGTYIGSERPMADGFAANCEFFKLEFLDKNAVAFGLAFKEILPLLWLKAGAKGVRPTIGDDANVPDMIILPENDFAVLTDEEYFSEFLDEIKKHDNIQHIFIVTDSNKGFQEMARSLRNHTVYQLYRDYLDNFRINLNDQTPQ